MHRGRPCRYHCRPFSALVTSFEGRNIRAFRVGLLVAAGCGLAGCSAGMSDYWANYNGFPMLGMAKKAADNNPNDALIRTPQYNSAQRFNKPADGSGSDGNSSAGGSSPMLGTTTPFDQAAEK